MISKVITGATFYGTCRYICIDQKRAEILELEGVRGYNYKLMAADFEMQQAYRPTLTKAVFHGILSFYPGEKIDNQTMVAIAKGYLQKMKIVDTQFAIIKHIDKNHPHLHIIANLVNNKGVAIKDNWIGLRGKKVSQELTSNYGLKEATSKNLSLTNLEALNEKESNRYVIYQAISEKLPVSTSLDDLREKLEDENIETLYKFNGQTSELQGVSFKIGSYKYKGSEIDRKFSIKNLGRTIQQQKMQNLLNPKKLSQTKSLSGDRRQSIGKHQAHNKSVLEELMKPVKTDQSVAHEFLIKKHTHKKSRGLHL